MCELMTHETCSCLLCIIIDELQSCAVQQSINEDVFELTQVAEGSRVHALLSCVCVLHVVTLKVLYMFLYIVYMCTCIIVVYL